MVFGLTQPGIKPESTDSVAEALSTDRLKIIDYLCFCPEFLLFDAKRERF